MEIDSQEGWRQDFAQKLEDPSKFGLLRLSACPAPFSFL